MTTIEAASIWPAAAAIPAFCQALDEHLGVTDVRFENGWFVSEEANGSPARFQLFHEEDRPDEDPNQYLILDGEAIYVWREER